MSFSCSKICFLQITQNVLLHFILAHGFLLSAHATLNVFFAPYGGPDPPIDRWLYSNNIITCIEQDKELCFG